MPSENLPRQDALFAQWLDNFATIAAENATELGLTTGQTTTITAYATAFQTAYDASQVGKNTQKGLIGDKDVKRTAAEALVRPYAKQFLANPNIPTQLKADLGLKITPTPLGPVVTPADLAVDTLANGDVNLKWNRSGNAQGTSFIIESAPALNGPYTIVGSTTKSKLTLTGGLPGTVGYYRVFAQRGDFNSSPCAPVVTNGSTESETIFLKKAA